jgi:N-acyl-D-aspartate/D-glutamate deacylase
MCIIFAALAAFATTDVRAADVAPYDVVVLGGRVVDGSGYRAYVSDIGIRDGVIVAIGKLGDAAARTRINAGGKVVTPGFFDMMGQSSLVYVTDRPAAESRLRQGITTHLAGEGSSHAPQNEHTQPSPVRIGDREVTWRRFSEYFEILESEKLPLNVVHNVGAAQVRRVVLGEKDRDPTPDELAAMEELVRQAMEDGAIGLSTSLIYPPGNYASTDELVALAKVVAPFGGIYLTHMRNESHALIEAIDEAIQIGKMADIPVHIYHLKAAGRDNWPLMQKAIDHINVVREDGLDVTADIYPYIRNGIGLRSFLPPYHYAEGSDAFIATLDDQQVRRKLRTEVETDYTWENWYKHVGEDWDKVLITGASGYEDPSIAGLSVAGAAMKAGLDEWDMFFELVKAGVGVAPESMNEGQKHLALKTPWVMICTDSSAANPANVKTTHPRAFGAFPRVIAKYVREDNVLSLEEAVRRMTSLPANRLGIRDRGRIALSMAADIAIFDENVIQDTATFANPTGFAEGIDYLLVNGTLVIDDGELTDELPGRVLRKQGVHSVK